MHDDSIVTRVISALHQLVALEANVSIFHEADGPVVIKESIRKHERSLPIQEDCLGIFAHATNETSRDSIAADAGVELILKVLHANKDRRALQRDGLKVMQLLGEVAEYRDEIRAGGGLMIVL